MDRIPKLRTALLLFSSVTILACSTAQPSLTGNTPQWEKIGEKKVDRKLDRDEIFVLKSNDLFTAIQFRVSRSSVNIARCSIYFDNGKVKDVKLGQNIGEGGQSKTIKFGLFGARAVTKVVVWYDTMDDNAKKSVVEVWGQR